MVLAFTTFTVWAWATRSSPEVLAPHMLQARVTAAARGGPLHPLRKMAGLMASISPPILHLYLHYFSLSCLLDYPPPPPLLHPTGVKMAMPEDLSTFCFSFI